MSSVYPFSGFLDSDENAREPRITITVVCPISGEITSVDELDLSDTSVDIVVATLKRLCGEIRKADRTLYAKKSMITLRFGLLNIQRTLYFVTLLVFLLKN
jgi:hypothetical protein